MLAAFGLEDGSRAGVRPRRKTGAERHMSMTGNGGRPAILRNILLAGAHLGLGVVLLGALATAGHARSEDSEPAATNFTAGTGVSRVSSMPKEAAAAAVYTALKGDYAKAARMALASHDPVAVKLVEWLYLRAEPGKAGPERLSAFARANPKWPYVRSLRAKAEKELLLQADRALLERHFSRYKPITASGYAALARLRLLQGRRQEAARALRRAWANPWLDAKVEAFIAANMRGLLGRADHERRLWRLIMAQQTLAGLRTARFLPAPYPAAAKAARALMRLRREGPALYRRLPAAMRAKTAMRYAYARYLRKRGPWTSALAMLERLPKRSAQIDPKQWWVEKRLLARYLLSPKYRKYWPRAYRLAASHGYRRPGKAGFRGEFLAGFIALEKLHQPGRALSHFRRMPRFATTRTQKSKAWYWVGRAREASGDLAGARRAYAESAKTPSVYYGLLSREKLGLGHVRFHVPAAWPTARAKADLRKHEFGRAVRILARAGADRHIGAFIWPLAFAFNDRAHLAAAASILWDAGGPGMAVRLAKATGSRGIDLDNYGYPVKALPKFRHLGPPLSKPALLALIRQESEFNARAGSHAGAKGLMQLMPRTARYIAGKLGLPYKRAWLINRPSYNLTLGRYYVAREIERFGGSYILGFAAYNAGGGNVNKWLKLFGDPRTGRPDPIDWVEMIPVTETRRYVQKLIQNMHIYRMRLNMPARPISRDLWRGARGWHEQVMRSGAAGKAAPARHKTPKPGACGKGKPGSINDLLKNC